MWRYILLIALLSGLLWQCMRMERNALTHLSYNPTPYVLEEPAGFVRMVIPEDNPLTHEGIALGRRLFFDPLLSVDSTVSCATCHLPHLAFTDGQVQSVGVQGRRGRRNAPTLFNIGYLYKGLFWDGRVATLEAQSLHPVTDSIEMANTWPEVERRLRQHPEYPAWFRQAFGIRRSSQIDSTLIAKALAQFQRTLISANARFDRKMRGELAFTPQEQRGWTIFFDASPDVPHAECAHCHADPLFTTLEFANNGIDTVPSLEHFPDRGRGAVTGNRYDNGMFRVPTLRNIAFTAPYMHDGRFATLGQVIDHYVSGGHYADNLNPNIRPLHLSPADKADLIAFLHTLTDSTALQRAY